MSNQSRKREAFKIQPANKLGQSRIEIEIKNDSVKDDQEVFNYLKV